MSWTFEELGKGFTLTEGPAWDGTGLLFTDIRNARIMRYDPGTSRMDVYRADTNNANGLMFDKDGRQRCSTKDWGAAFL